MSFTVTGRPQLRPMVQAVPRMQRRLRRPQHQFFLHFRPWELTPFFAAPVVPGETLKSALMQARVLSSPIKNQVVGWWLETYWFYVKHRHLTGLQPGLTDMMLDSTLSAPDNAGIAEVAMQTAAGEVNYMLEAYKLVVDEFFRGDGETSSGAGVAADNLNLVRIKLPGWWDSILPATALTDGTGGIGDDTIGTAALDTVGEVGKALEQWQTLRMLGVTQLEYDDWLRSFGVSIAAPVDDRPELIRYTREWQLPSSQVSVDATAQRVSSVVSWSPTERLDKDRYFKEPGILFGCVVARPKVYHTHASSGLGQLANAMAWQTPMRSGAPYELYQELVADPTFGFDPTDLFNHGDQWVRVKVGTGNVPSITWDGESSFPAYAEATDVNAMFVDGANGHLKMDGVVNLTVASAHVGLDTTPRTV